MVESVPVRYARSGDLRIAYQRFGDGDLDVLISPGFISNLDMAWDMPAFRVIFDRLGSFARCITFDKRGTGLSDRDLGFGSLDERMDDLRLVLDDAEIERAALFGYSEGGPLSLLFAATYPERVTGLAIYGGMARLREAPDYPVDRGAGSPELISQFIDRIEALWGRGQALRFFIQHAPDDPDTTDLIARYERSAASPSMAAQILKRNAEIDIRDILPTISVPTLVLHTADDPVVMSTHGRYLATHVPGATYVERPGRFHMTWDAAQAWYLDEVEAFFTGARRSHVHSERILATILFTDIVGSTENAARLGDDAWRRLLDDHDRHAAETVRRNGGRVVKTTGDGVLAVLDSPSRAIACAVAIRDRLRPLGLRIRAGVHTGEVEQRGDDVGGIGVHIGARIAHLAEADEIWISRTVRDLTAGSGLVFTDRGRHALKGVPDEWDLYALVSRDGASVSR